MFCVTKWALAHFFLAYLSTFTKVEQNRIEPMVESLLKAEGLELVELEFRKEARGWVFEFLWIKQEE